MPVVESRNRLPYLVTQKIRCENAKQPEKHEQEKKTSPAFVVLASHVGPGLESSPNVYLKLTPRWS